MTLTIKFHNQQASRFRIYCFRDRIYWMEPNPSC